jgi:uncharacterized membrane protein YraQ (UPF0718 family)
MVEQGSCCHSGKAVFYKNKLFLTACLIAALLAAPWAWPALAAWRAAFLLYIGKIWWAILAGLLVGGAIEYYIPREYISHSLASARPSSIFRAVSLGFLMSACSHGVLAISIQLHKKGASNPAVVSFLLASPWANFTITVMLLGFFGWKGLFIIFGALLVAINTGFIFMFLEKKGLVEKNKNSLQLAGDFSIAVDVRKRMKAYRFSIRGLIRDAQGVAAGALALSDMVLRWVVMGILIASATSVYVPQHFFHRYLGPGIPGLFMTLLMATVIEVCSEGSSPLAFEIFRQTRALGNSFAFLMAGVVTDYTEIGLLWASVGRRVALFMPLVSVPQVLLLGYLANVIFR